MNKVIFTDTRLFMSVVGPSGSGKTRLIFQMLLKRLSLILKRFHQEYQDIFDKIQSLLNIEFVSCVDFDFIEKLENCLLIFDDSCEEIYNDKRFSKLATSGRHKNVYVIYVKHNLFFQSKFSKTIDLNNTHVILFKSPRDINQIRVLGKQLGEKQSFIEHCYQRATSEPFGHLMIDLYPRTQDCLRYCSNIVGPTPSIFYLPSSKAVVTELINGHEKRGYTEKRYQNVDAQAKAFLKYM